nr:uncharacterized protein LOC128685765 [Cherax quadricarinatus]
MELDKFTKRVEISVYVGWTKEVLSRSGLSIHQRLLGGLSKDKEFLVSLLGRRSLRQEVVTVDGGGQVTHTSCQVAAVAKEALSSLQHLESFMWQRDPGDSTGRPGAVDGGAGKTLLQKEREKKERARLKVTLRRRTAILLQQLHQDADVEETLRAAEELVAEVKSVGVGGRLLCRLLVGVGVALPKCNRHEDAIAVLTDAVHIARASEYGEEEHMAVEALGRTLANRGQHAEAVSVWERRIPAAKNSRQRASLFLLIAKSYFGPETLGAWSKCARRFLKEMKNSSQSKDPRVTNFLFQSLSVTIQRENPAAFRAHDPVPESWMRPLRYLYQLSYSELHGVSIESFLWQRDPGDSTGRRLLWMEAQARTFYRRKGERKSVPRLKVISGVVQLILLQQLHQDADGFWVASLPPPFCIKTRSEQDHRKQLLASSISEEKQFYNEGVTWRHSGSYVMSEGS